MRRSPCGQRSPCWRPRSGRDESDPELYQIAALLLREEEKRRRMDELERSSRRRGEA